MTIDSDLKLRKHFSELCKKANRKISALSRLGKYVSFGKKIFKVFTESQFIYYHEKCKLFNVTKFILVLPIFQLIQQSLSRTIR